MPKVSVIMPAYKTEEYIKESIQSVQNQTFQDWELLVINDGSPDQLENIVAELATHDPRIRLISQVNQGVAVARNTGIAEAQGEFISFLDSDDLWEPTFLEKMLQKATSDGLDIVYSGFYKEMLNGKIKAVGSPDIEKQLLLERLKSKQGLHICALLIRQAFRESEQILFTPDCSFSEDTEFILKLLCNAQIGAVKENLFHYKNRDGSLTNSSWSLKREDSLKAFERAQKFIIAKYPHKDKSELLIAFDFALVSLFYRIIINAVVTNNFDAVNHLLDTYSHLLHKKGLKRSKQIKLKLIATRQVFIWRILGYL